MSSDRAQLVPTHSGLRTLTLCHQRLGWDKKRITFLVSECSQIWWRGILPKIIKVLCIVSSQIVREIRRECGDRWDNYICVLCFVFCVLCLCLYFVFVFVFCVYVSSQIAREIRRECGDRWDRRDHCVLFLSKPSVLLPWSEHNHYHHFYTPVSSIFRQIRSVIFTFPHFLSPSIERDGGYI